MRTVKMARCTWKHVVLVFCLVVVVQCRQRRECGTRCFVEYRPGELNVVLISPHGGRKSPRGSRARDAGCWDGQACDWSFDCGQKDHERCRAVVVSTFVNNRFKKINSQIRQHLINRLVGFVLMKIWNLEFRHLLHI